MVNILIHQFEPGGAVVDAAALEQFQRQWATYQKLVDSELEGMLSAAAAQDPQPELHIRGDKAVRYERVALAMAAAQKAGLRKIGFITEPTP